MRSTDSRAEGESPGQALVEFAMVAPLLFLMMIGIFEVSRYILFQQTLNNATREGARYAIVHGANSSCPSGPWPEPESVWGPPPTSCDGTEYPYYDATGQRILERVEEAAVGLIPMGDLRVGAPVWTEPLDWAVPRRDALDDLGSGGDGNGDNARGSHVTVFADFAYDTIFDLILGTDLLPKIEIRTESTLVINN